jgi:hypothetical protein
LTPIELTAFDATPTEEGVVLTWEVPEAEFDGFVLWRAEGLDPELEAYAPLNPEAPVRGQGSLRYVDRGAEAGRTYSYLIEALAGGAGSRFYGPVHATAITVRVFALGPPAPNPARSTVTLSIDLPAPGEPELAIYELSGRQVRRLRPGPLGAGRHPIVWDARNERGHPVASGLSRPLDVARPRRDPPHRHPLIPNDRGADPRAPAPVRPRSRDRAPRLRRYGPGRADLHLRFRRGCEDHLDEPPMWANHATPLPHSCSRASTIW